MVATLFLKLFMNFGSNLQTVVDVVKGMPCDSQKTKLHLMFEAILLFKVKCNIRN